MNVFFGMVLLLMSFFLFSIKVDNYVVINVILNTLGVIAIIAGLKKIIRTQKK
jgi:cadmium resistance protein CadD (predicted permease)